MIIQVVFDHHSNTNRGLFVGPPIVQKKSKETALAWPLDLATGGLVAWAVLVLYPSFVSYEGIGTGI